MRPETLERVFGRGRLKMATGDHVEVHREAVAAGERRRYTKRFLETGDADFREWTGREWRILARLIGHGVRCVPDVVRFDGGAAGGIRQVETYDAGVTVDQWATLLPVERGGAVHRNVFEDCAHWWALAHHCLAALDEIHALALVHLDVKADNVCIPCLPAGFDPAARAGPLSLQFERLALIDFAFSVVTRERLSTALPLGWQKDYDYQSPRLLRALDLARAGDLGPTQELDWRCDLYSLAAMLRRHLPDEGSALAPDAPTGWTPGRYDAARELVLDLRAAHDADATAWRPHRAWLARTGALLESPDLAASLVAGWTLSERPADGAPPPTTPLTRIVPRVTASPLASIVVTPCEPVATPAVVRRRPAVVADAEAAVRTAATHVVARRSRTASPLRTVAAAICAAAALAMPAALQDEALLPHPFAAAVHDAVADQREPDPLRSGTGAELSAGPDTAGPAAPSSKSTHAATRIAPDTTRPSTSPREAASARSATSARRTGQSGSAPSGKTTAPSSAGTQPAAAPRAASTNAARLPASNARAGAASATRAAYGFDADASRRATDAIALAALSGLSSSPVRGATAANGTSRPDTATAPRQATDPAPGRGAGPVPLPAGASTSYASAGDAIAPAAVSPTPVPSPRADATPHSGTRDPGDTVAPAAVSPAPVPGTRAEATPHPGTRDRPADTRPSDLWRDVRNAFRALGSIVKRPAPVEERSAAPSAGHTAPAPSVSTGRAVEPVPPAEPPRDILWASPAEAPRSDVTSAIPRSGPAVAANADDALARRARGMLADGVPLAAMQAREDLSAVLDAAARAVHPSQNRDVLEAARMRWLSERLLLPVADGAGRARALHAAGTAAYARGRTEEALDIELRAFGADPGDPEVAGFLAFLHLRASPGHAETARLLALHALAMSGRHRAERTETWSTFAVASALTGHGSDATRAFLAQVALARDLERACRVAQGAYATYGERLRKPVLAMQDRVRAQGREDESPSCTPPADRAIARLP